MRVIDNLFISPGYVRMISEKLFYARSSSFHDFTILQFFRINCVTFVIDGYTKVLVCIFQQNIVVSGIDCCEISCC